MDTNIVTPIQQNQRTAIVDILRGWALLGVAIMNYISFSEMGNIKQAPKPDTAGDMVYNILGIFFTAKSWTMLSLLFGYGFAVLINNLQKKGINPVKFFTARMLWLFVIAFINCCFFYGDVLKDYAFMGLILLLFYKSNAKFTFKLALVLIVLAPVVASMVKLLMPYPLKKLTASIAPLFHSHNLFGIFKANLIAAWRLEILLPSYIVTVHWVMLACFLLGYSACKFDIFTHLTQRLPAIKRTFWYTLIFALVLNLISTATAKYNWTYTKYFNPRYWTILSSMIAIMAAICWLYAKDKCKVVFGALQAIGKMTLTNYLVQNIISMIVFSGFGFGLYNTLHPVFYVVMAIGIYVIQVFFSRWWLKKYYYGPAEWLWRQLSYGTRLPLKKQADPGLPNTP